MKPAALLLLTPTWLACGAVLAHHPCVTQSDCEAGYVCSESMLCQKPPPEGMQRCVSAQQGGGLESVLVRAGEFAGDVGPFHGYRATACDQAGYWDGRQLHVNTVIPSERGPAMTLFSLQGGTHRGDLTPGKTVTFYGHDDAVVFGCSQWMVDNWGFDIPSNQVAASVSQAPNGDWLYRYTAHFTAGADPVYGPYGDHDIRGSFQMPPQ